MKFTTGIKTCLIALFAEIWRNLYWILLIIAYAVMLWLAPKANATALDDYLAKHNLILPPVALQEIEKQDLVAACGIEDTRNSIFTVYVLKKDDIPPAPLQIDVSKAILKVHFYLVKKRIIVEGVFCKEIHPAGKCWPNNRTEKVYFFYDFWRL